MQETEKKYVEQLVEVVAKKMVEAFESITIEDVNMYKLGYSKAIDDLTERTIKELEDCKTVCNKSVGKVIVNDFDLNTERIEMLDSFIKSVKEISEEMKGKL